MATITTHTKIFASLVIWAVTTINSYGLETFCFNKSVNLDEVKSYLSPIILPKDKIGKRELSNCLEVETSSERLSLINSYLSKKYDLQSTNLATAKSCRIRVESETDSESSRTRVNAKPLITGHAFERSGKGTSQSELTVLQGRYGVLRYEDEMFHITCVERGAGNFEIEIHLRADSGASDVITSLLIQKNQKTEIGNFIKKYKDDHNGISSRKGVSFRSEDYKKVSSFYITIL